MVYAKLTPKAVMILRAWLILTVASAVGPQLGWLRQNFNSDPTINRHLARSYLIQ